jgi:hypothetical protein
VKGKSWSIFLILAGLAMAILILIEVIEPSSGIEAQGSRVRLSTRTPTLTRTVGWWAEVATWTPTDTRQTNESAPTIAVTETPTPNLDIPPVRTLIPPTHGGAP